VAIDMNMDVGELFKSFLNKELFKSLLNKKGSGVKSSVADLADNPYAKIIIAGVVVLIIIILYVAYVYLPMQDKLQKQQEQISQISSLKSNIAVLDVRIAKADIKLKEAQKNYNSRTKLFHSDKEKEGLYSHISMLALQHQLSVSKIEPMEREPIFEVQKEPVSKKEKDSPRKVAYYVFKVEFEISGNYTNYTDFRKSMAELKKIINIEEEKIIVLKSKKRAGEVKVSAILSTYSVPNEDK